MPNRVIRESLLDSERYWHCTIEARELYRHMQLLADDFGCLSLAPVLLKRRCFENPPTPEKLSHLLGQLVDNDLLRRYETGGAVYGFIPRYKQRLQRWTLKHPKPPESIYQDDEHATKLFNIIKDGRKQATEGDMLAIGAQSDPKRIANGDPSNEVEVKGSERKRREVEVKGRDGVGALAAKLNVKPFDGEEMDDFKIRLNKILESKA